MGSACLSRANSGLFFLLHLGDLCQPLVNLRRVFVRILTHTSFSDAEESPGLKPNRFLLLLCIIKVLFNVLMASFDILGTVGDQCS